MPLVEFANPLHSVNSEIILVYYFGKILSRDTMEIDIPDEHKDSLESFGFSTEERDLLDLIARLIVECVLYEKNHEAQKKDKPENS